MAQLHDLFTRAGQGMDVLLLRELLSVRRYPREVPDAGLGTDLFSHYIERNTGFPMKASLFFLIAFLFVVGYILVATGGSWAWLKNRGRLHYSWPAFAAVAVAASATSLAAVQFIRGIGHDVQQLTVVDGEAGTTQAAAICYFGLKSAAHATLDVSVPADWRRPNESPETPGSLYPLPADPDDLDPKSYAAGQVYEAVASLGQLRAVPLRATLKQFRGYWQGRLPGQIDAALQHRDRSSFRLSTSSWIENCLGINLHYCYLFVAGRNLMGEPGEGPRTPHRWQSIEVYPLGDLPNGQRLTIGAWIERKIQAQSAGDAETIEWRPEALKTVAQDRGDSFFRKVGLRAARLPRYGRETAELEANDWVSALLLLTLSDELDQSDLFTGGQYIRQSRSQELDRSRQLTREMALLVGFADDADAGPARLCWRPAGQGVGGWRAVQPDHPRTVYRVSIPVAPP